MIDRYELPRHFEGEELTALLVALSPKQRRVLRNYVDHVELGDMSVTAWLLMLNCPVTERSWYKRGARAQFRNCQAFQDALDAYLRAAVKAGAVEETKAIAKAKRTLRLGAARAAERLVYLVDEADRQADQVKAALGVLDRADMETAAKGEVEVSDARERLARLLGADDRGDGAGAEPGPEAGGAGGAER